MHHLNNLISDIRAATAVEYGLIVALIAVVLIATLTFIGTDIGNTMNEASDSM